MTAMLPPLKWKSKTYLHAWTIKSRKSYWINHILLNNFLLKRVIEGKRGKNGNYVKTREKT
jgi:hypothetical protein